MSPSFEPSIGGLFGIPPVESPFGSVLADDTQQPAIADLH